MYIAIGAAEIYSAVTLFLSSGPLASNVWATSVLWLELFFLPFPKFFLIFFPVFIFWGWVPVKLNVFFYDVITFFFFGKFIGTKALSKTGTFTVILRLGTIFMRTAIVSGGTDIIRSNSFTVTRESKEKFTWWNRYNRYILFT